VRELKELAARRKAEAESTKVATQAGFSSLPPADATQSAPPAERAQADSLAVPETAVSPRPTSPAPHHLAVHVAAASALPADFFDAGETTDSSNSVEESTAAASQQLSAEAAVDSSGVQHPTAMQPEAGEGQQLSALIDDDRHQSDEAEAEAERERLETEAAIALAIAMSKQQSQHSQTITSSSSATVTSTTSRPASPLPVPVVLTAAASLPDALEAFEAELAVAEEEARVRSKEEEGRLARMRRDVDEIEDEERKQRLEDIKQRVAEAKRKREEQQQQQTTVEEGALSSKKRKTSKQTIAASVQEEEEDGDLMTELDGMFDWRRQQR